MSAFETIDYQKDGGVATLTLNRPDCLNSFNQQMHREMAGALKTIKKDKEVRCLLLTGAGRGFCAGQDLNDRAVSSDESVPDLGESLERYYNPMIRTLMTLEMPVICAVNGVAAGAGANLALAGDIVLAGRSAKFIQAFSKIGLVPDSGGTWQLTRLVGRARAMALSMLAEPVSAEQAQDWGMIWRCVEDELLLEEAQKLAQHLSTQPTRCLALIKRAVNQAASSNLNDQLDLERDLQRLAGRTQDYREGVAAFMEKRPARFEGA